MSAVASHLHSPGASAGMPRIPVVLTGDAAARVVSLRQRTGHSYEGLLEIAIGLVEILANARSAGQRLLLVSRFGFPSVA